MICHLSAAGLNSDAVFDINLRSLTPNACLGTRGAAPSLSLPATPTLGKLCTAVSMPGMHSSLLQGLGRMGKQMERGAGTLGKRLDGAVGRRGWLA